ncbi:MAG: prepilin-type N-terminal cleavage/methylation domain-containing protein [bacterium]|nr:prepilin-type N-terminal cleavage/methylation domain-containing protein [bacterium]
MKLLYFFDRCLGSIHPAHRRSIGSEGFNLFELMMVTAIIGILSAIAIPALINYRSKAKIALAVSEIRMLEKEIQNYELDNIRFPDDLSETKLGSIRDPWDNSYQYLKIAEDDDKAEEEKSKPREDHLKARANSDFDLYSMGKDGKSKTSFTSKESYDDIVRANDGQFIGLVADY